MIKINQDFEDCLNASKDRLKVTNTTKNGLRNITLCTSASKMKASKKLIRLLWRLNSEMGTIIEWMVPLRSSVLYDLGEKGIKALVFDFEDLRVAFPHLDSIYQEWILGNYQNYQKIDESGQSSKRSI